MKNFLKLILFGLSFLACFSAFSNLYQCPNPAFVQQALKSGNCHYGFDHDGWSISCDAGATNNVKSFFYALWAPTASSGNPGLHIQCSYNTQTSQSGVASRVYLVQKVQDNVHPPLSDYWKLCGAVTPGHYTAICCGDGYSAAGKNANLCTWKLN